MNAAELTQIRQKTLKAISPLRAGDARNYFWGERTEAGRELPPYYVVHFVLSELLGFPTLGKQEKVAWSIVLDFEGKTFVIEHRKLGLGIFAQDLKCDEANARRIAKLIASGVKASEPYLEWIAETAVQNSKLNLLNKCKSLLERVQYFLGLYKKIKQDAASKNGESLLRFLPDGTAESIHPSRYDLEREADWLAISAIEAFYSWTEHLFIHLALFNGTILSGTDTANLAEAEWAEKFKKAIDLSDASAKLFYDELIQLRRQVRNFVAHGAFGKRGEAFQFHSKAGAVPVLMPHKKTKARFSIFGDMSFREEAAIHLVEKFIEFLRNGSQAPAFKYLHESGLPTVLTYVQSGIYRSALASMHDMDALIYRMQADWSRSIDMDW